MRSLVVIALVMAVHPALAEPETQLIGRITETATGRPIEGAHVAISHGDTQLEVITDKQGLYRFTVPEGGAYKITYTYANVTGEATTQLAPGKPNTFDAKLDVDSESVIYVRERKPMIPPKMVKDARRKIAPEYSDAAIEKDAWTRAWLLLDIDDRGSVTRVKMLNAPGYDLESIALKQAFRTQFEPARDASGRPARSLLVWPIEWPSYWWMVMHEGVATRIPDAVVYKPCRDSGRPLQMGSLHPVYRDCSKPNLTKIGSAKWIYRP